MEDERRPVDLPAAATLSSLPAGPEDTNDGVHIEPRLRSSYEPRRRRFLLDDRFPHERRLALKASVIEADMESFRQRQSIDQNYDEFYKPVRYLLAGHEATIKQADRARLAELFVKIDSLKAQFCLDRNIRMLDEVERVPDAGIWEFFSLDPSQHSLWDILNRILDIRERGVNYFIEQIAKAIRRYQDELAEDLRHEVDKEYMDTLYLLREAWKWFQNQDLSRYKHE